MNEVPLYGMPDKSSETGYEFGYGYWLPPYSTGYRRALRTTRTRRRRAVAEKLGQFQEGTFSGIHNFVSGRDM